MSSKNVKIAQPYAEAFLELASKNSLETTVNDLNCLISSLNNSKELKTLLANPLINSQNKKNIIKVGTEIVIIMWVLAILIYLARNFIEVIPSPFDGLYGFQHNLVKELGSASVFAMILFSYFYFFKSKLDYFNKSITRGYFE